MNARRQLFMAGMVGTGKTTYLALFYLALINDQASGLKLGSYEGNFEYLNEIADQLLRCDRAVHTEVAEERELSLSLEVSPDHDQMWLRMPDLSGETWEDAVLQRHWPQGLDDQIAGSQGMLLFVHAKQIDAGATLGQMSLGQELLSPKVEQSGVASEPEHDTAVRDAEVPDSGNTVAEASSSAGAEPSGVPNAHADPQSPDVDAAKTASGRSERPERLDLKGDPPTQVQLVDLIQLTLEQRGQRPARVCVMVSAWDTVKLDCTPAEFVSQNLPLLDQYLTSNQNWLSSRVYGVSAQGGSFDDEEAKKKLAARDALDRAYLKGGDDGLAAIGDPVVWALGLAP